MKKTLLFLLLAVDSFSFCYEIQELSLAPRIFWVDNFLSNDECDYLIKIAGPGLKQSKVVDERCANGEIIDNRRKSLGIFLTNRSQDPVIFKIEARLSELTAIPKQNGESLHVLYYGKGGEYQPHYDFFNSKTAGGGAHLLRGGQRIATVIIYLNEPRRGGETIFPKASLSVVPKKGAALLFYSCLLSGEEDFLTLHGGAPVIEGEKWIATKWFRMNTFR